VNVIIVCQVPFHIKREISIFKVNSLDNTFFIKSLMLIIDSITRYANRIDQLTRAVAIHTMVS
jgi:hypothetical protein